MAKDGWMIQDDNGDLYFLRPEILAAAKVEKSLHKDAEVALKAAKKTTKAPKIKVLGALRLVDAPNLSAKSASASAKAAVAIEGAAVRVKIPTTKSTIMCPW